VATGEFGADMKVSLTNDGPITFLVRSREPVAMPSPS
jgi:D-tyrosyl-tRNA(Tyr) deacylase